LTGRGEKELKRRTGGRWGEGGGNKQRSYFLLENLYVEWETALELWGNKKTRRKPPRKSAALR